MNFEQQQDREPTIFNSRLTLLFVGLFLFIALLYRQNDFALLAILILVVVGGARAWAAMSTGRIRWKSAMDNERVFPGESVTLATTVENGKWLPVWLNIKWSFEDALQPGGNKDGTVLQEAAVLWHQNVKFQQALVPMCRGVYQVGPPSILASDFLGFFEKEVSARKATQLLVYPRLVSLKPIPTRKRDLYGVPGSQSPVKDPVYILGTRDYQSTSPSRHIHWKASARHLLLQEKIFEPSEQARVLLAVDAGSFEEYKQGDYFEHTLEVVASLAVNLDKVGFAVGIATNGILKGGGLSAIPLARGPQQIPAILETLARIQARPEGTMANIIKRFPGSWRGVSCVHFCYQEDTSMAEIEKIYQRRHLPVSFVVGRRTPNSRTTGGRNRFSIEDIRLDRSHEA